MKKEKEVIIIMITTGTQALNLKNSGWIFEVSPFWLELNKVA